VVVGREVETTEDGKMLLGNQLKRNFLKLLIQTGM
jgi:hypothetical protein